MSLPATDAFTRADAASLGGNWSDDTGLGGLGITSNQAQAKATGGFLASWWTADVFSNDQYSKAVIPTANKDCFVLVRGSGDTFYMLYNPAAGGLLLFLRTPGTFTQIGTPTGTVANGDTIEIRAVGTSITSYVNGALRDTTADAAIASGSAGIGGLGSALSILDTWEGGNTGGGGGGLPFFMQGDVRHGYKQSRSGGMQ